MKFAEMIKSIIDWYGYTIVPITYRDIRLEDLCNNGFHYDYVSYWKSIGDYAYWRLDEYGTKYAIVYPIGSMPKPSNHTPDGRTYATDGSIRWKDPIDFYLGIDLK